jgi:hypothetical protein
MSSANEPAQRAARETWQRVDDAVQRFEAAWQSGSRPAIEDYLPPDGPNRPAMLVELVHVDLERRLKAGEAARVEEYLGRYLELASNADELLDLIAAEYEQRRRGEPGLHVEEYARRFPECGGQFRERLEQTLTDNQKPAPRGAQETADAGPGRITSDPGAEPTPAPPLASPVWPQMAGYQVLGELGRGAMGIVYKARQVRPNRLVALKMILAGVHAGEQELVRFRAEADALARLQHPNFVQVYEVGEHDGLPYFSQEFCAGGNLADRLNGRPLPARDAAALMETLAHAVHAAHGQGVIHRDLKPANVLLAGDGTPKVADFGLAKRLDALEQQTASGAILGTPSYMAPEQAGGHSREV